MNEVQVVKEADKSLTPAYIWKTGKTFFLSKKEWIVAETYIRTRKYSECARALKKEGFNYNWKTCGRWLEKKHIQEYIAEKLDESGVYVGWTKEHWYKVMTDHLRTSSEYAQAENELKMHRDALSRNKNDLDALVGEARAKDKMLKALNCRLGNGDLYGMNLIAKYKGWEVPSQFSLNQQINILQSNGKE